MDKNLTVYKVTKEEKNATLITGAIKETSYYKAYQKFGVKALIQQRWY